MNYRFLAPAPLFTGRDPGGIPTMRTTAWGDPLLATVHRGRPPRSTPAQQRLRGVGFELPDFMEEWTFEDEGDVGPGFKDTMPAPPPSPVPSPGGGVSPPKPVSPGVPSGVTPPFAVPPAAKTEDGLSMTALAIGGVAVLAAVGGVVYFKKMKKGR